MAKHKDLRPPERIQVHLRILSLAVAVPGCIKIAKSFGKGTVFGVLMAIPGLRVIMRLILGLSKAKYLGKG